MIDQDRVFDALRMLETGKQQPGEQFDWNRDWVHGYASRDVASALRVTGRPSTTWTEVYPVLDALASAGRVVRVVVGSGRVPVYRTVGN